MTQFYLIYEIDKIVYNIDVTQFQFNFIILKSY